VYSRTGTFCNIGDQFVYGKSATRIVMDGWMFDEKSLVELVVPSRGKFWEQFSFGWVDKRKSTGIKAALQLTAQDHRLKSRRAAMTKAEKVVGRKLVRMAVEAACLALMLSGSVARAQNASLAPGCGPDAEHFDVKTDKSQHPEAKDDAGKAAVYFVQDDPEFQGVPKPVLRMGIDGKWIGATHGTSYAMILVDPGEHHLCARGQGIGMGKLNGALHFTAQAGKSYFFVAKDRFYHDSGILPL
jgi:hypothetical protein